MIADALQRLRDLPEQWEREGAGDTVFEASQARDKCAAQLRAVLITLQGVQEPPRCEAAFHLWRVGLDGWEPADEHRCLCGSIRWKDRTEMRRTGYKTVLTTVEARAPHPERTVMPSVDADSTMHLQRPLHQHGEAALSGASVDAGEQHPAKNTAVRAPQEPPADLQMLYNEMLEVAKHGTSWEQSFFREHPSFLARFQRAIEAQEARPAPPLDWQPIETAPRDGREVLAYDEGAIVLASWVEGEDGTGWFDHGIMQPPPTHWMPPPSPPAAHAAPTESPDPPAAVPQAAPQESKCPH